MGKNAQRRRQGQQLRKIQERNWIKEHLQKQGIQQQQIRQPAKVAPLPPVPGATSRLKMAAQIPDIINQISGKKVIAFLQDVFDCCSEKCILEYADMFQRENYACLMIPHKSYQDILKYLANYVVLFRLGMKEMSVEEARVLLSYISHLKSLGIRIVYYADDLIFWMNNSIPLTLAKAADAIIVTNETLRSMLVTKGQVHVPITIVPTHIRLDTFDNLPVKSPIPLSNRFKVLLTSQGRIGINHAFEICEMVNEDPELAEATEWVFNANGVAQVRAVVNRFRNLHKTYIDWMELQNYYSLMKAVDVIIHPAAPADLDYLVEEGMQQPWLDSKSEVKYTLAGAARIPIISSPAAAYRDAIKDGETGFIAVTAADFVKRIKQLQGDRNLCKKIGLAARKDVEQRYNITTRYAAYRDAIIGANSPKTSVPEMFTPLRSQTPKLFIPPIEGGPRSFYENMKRWLPIMTGNKWEVTENIREAQSAIAIAFVAADEIIKEKQGRKDLQVIYRLDGLPMNFSGELEKTNLAKMQELFDYADILVWQSKHCYNMWTSKELVPAHINPKGPIIHNGVDLNIFRPDGRSYSFPNARKYNLLNLNWSTFPHKRLDLLQDTIKEYAGNPDVRFFMLGNYINTNQIANVNFWRGFPNVTYLGQMRNQSKEAKEILASIYRTSTALVFTSEMEGSPNTVLEAMGCCCPVLYNANSDIVPEILGNACLPLDKLPLIFEPEYRESLQKGMIPLVESFSIEESCRKYVKLLPEKE